MEGSCKYIEWAVTDSWQGVVLQFGAWGGLTTPYCKIHLDTECFTGPR
jgi:hypothetical protein